MISKQRSIMLQIKDRLHILCSHTLGPSQCRVVGFLFFLGLIQVISIFELECITFIMKQTHPVYDLCGITRYGNCSSHLQPQEKGSHWERHPLWLYSFRKWTSISSRPCTMVGYVPLSPKIYNCAIAAHQIKRWINKFITKNPQI